MRKKKKIYTVGDRPTVYLKQGIPEELIKLINEQSDLTLFFTHSIELFHERYGMQDAEAILPRQYEFLSGAKVNAPEPAKQSKNSLSDASEDLASSQPSLKESKMPKEDVSESVQPSDGKEENDYVQKTEEEKMKEPVKEEKKEPKTNWSSLPIDDDPYA